MSFELRPYQQHAEQQARIALAGGLRRVCLYLPTGAGKTLTATSIITKATAKGRKVAFIANRKQLVLQTSAVLHRYGIAHGILQAENTRSLDAQVLVASIDTVHVRGLPDDVGLIIIDECHGVAGSEKYRKLLAKYNALPVVGLSATPFAVGMAKGYPEIGGPLFEQLVVGATITDLIGDILAHWRKLAAGKQTVVFACSIPHSKHIVEQFQSAGIPAEHIDYHHDDEERAAILDRFARGETTVLSNVALLSEGWDCPSTEVMILARPTRSLIRFIQMVGRVLRPAPGKERALLLDHSGSTARLGHPCDDLPLELDDGQPKTAGKQPAERQESLPNACPRCHFMRPARVHSCPKCGFSPERQSTVEIATGELVKQERKKPIRKQAGQHVYSQLLGYAESRGFKAGWAYHKYAEFFGGKHPNGLRQVAVTPTPEMLGWIKSRLIAATKSKEADRAGR